MLYIIKRFIFQADCPAPTDYRSGGYYCTNRCINNNIGIPDLATAWAKCGEVVECTRIMKRQDGQFYLRKLDDAYDPNANLQYVDFTCPRNDFILQMLQISNIDLRKESFYCQICEHITFIINLVCVSHGDCPDYQACKNKRCIEPCVEYPTCEDGYHCVVTNHSASCKFVGKF